MTKPSYLTGSELFGSWFDDVKRGEPPVRFKLPPPFDKLDLRPGRLFVAGGRPGSGKTAALTQIGIDLLRLNESARMLVANVEMVPSLIADRIVSRLSGVPLTAIADRTLTPGQLDRVQTAVNALVPVAGRLAFLHAPFALEHVATAADAFGANVIVLDYVQRLAVGDGRGDKREQLETIATVLRRFCDAGVLVLCASAVARQRSAGGSTYNGLNLASFRGSSELEYGADAAYILNPGEGGIVTFTCEKNRFGPLADIVTKFDGETQTFAVPPSGIAGFDAAAPAGPAKPPAKRKRRETINPSRSE